MTDPQPDKSPRPDDDEGPLLLEDILGAKKVLILIAALTILALLGFFIADPADFFG